MRPSTNIDLSIAFLSPTTRPKAVERCRKALCSTKGRVGVAAEKLNVSIRSLYRYIERYPDIIRGLDLPYLTLKAGQKRVRTTATSKRGKVAAA